VRRTRRSTKRARRELRKIWASMVSVSGLKKPARGSDSHDRQS
jgi:hypothetical protein